MTLKQFIRENKEDISLSKHERKIVALSLDFLLSELTDEDSDWVAPDDWKKMMITLTTQLLNKVYPKYHDGLYMRDTIQFRKNK